MGSYDTGRKTNFECFIQDAELLNSIPTRPCNMVYCHNDQALGWSLWTNLLSSIHRFTEICTS